jgi:hypothetical protein
VCAGTAAALVCAQEGKAMMNRIRDWGFPIVLIVSWVFVSGYTVNRLVEANQGRAAAAAIATHA